MTGRLIEHRFFADLATYNGGAGTPGEVWTFTYDAFGRQIAATQQVGTDIRATTTAYDAEGRITQIVSPEGAVNYEYDPVTGLRTRTTTGDAADPTEDFRYSYDALGRLAAVEVYKRSGEAVDVVPQTPGDQPEATRYEYDLIGNLLSERKANGVVADHVYDSLNRLDVLREFMDNNGNGVYDAGDSLLTRFDYTVRADGRRTGAVEQFWFEGEMHENTVAWSYDNLGRLVDEVFDHYENAFDQTDRFVHDLVGNRLEQTRDLGNDGTVDETTGYVYDANDRLQTEWFDGDGLPGAERETTYGYDRTQETLKEVREAGVLQSRTEYTYNLQGRMATVTVTSFESGVASRVERSTYEYSAAGIRVSALVEIDADADGTFETATKTEYLNDPQNHTGYSQVLVETVTDAATGEVQKRVVYTLGHDRLSQTTTTYAAGQPTATETLHFGQDGHGSTRVLFDALGAIATVAGVPQVFHYAAHGTPLGSDPSTAATTFLYSGEQTDATGLQYLRARYYNPATGRFTRLDPFFGVLTDPQSLHKYLYCHADPVMGVDPTGRFLMGFMMGTCIANGLHNAYDTAVMGAYDALRIAIEGAQAGLSGDAMIAQFFIEQSVGFALSFGSQITPIVSRVANKLGVSGSPAWRFLAGSFGSYRIVSMSKAAVHGFAKFSDLKRYWRQLADGIPSNHVVHHIVELFQAGKQFSAEAIHSVANSIPMPKGLHDAIGTMYSSGKVKLAFMKRPPLCNYSRFRDFVKELSWEKQMEIGWAVYDHVMEHGNLDTFDPFAVGLIK